MQLNSSNKIDPEKIKKDLLDKKREIKQSIKSKHKKAHQWLEANQSDFKLLKQKSQKLIASTTLAASLLLSPPPTSDISTSQEIRNTLEKQGYIGSDELETTLSQHLKTLLPQVTGHASFENEAQISQLISDDLGIKAIPQFEGQRLNHSYGWMGYEQHLKRFPGDNINLHDQETKAGIAPGLGAWSYFAYSKSDFTNNDYMKEKYYFAVQTLYLPNWNSDLRHLVSWYKHRKMIAINPENGKAVVGVVADAGPAKFTGKQFGGSPEVMSHLQLIYGKKKGKVLLYFVDDPQDQIPLGPVRSNYQIAKLIET